MLCNWFFHSKKTKLPNPINQLKAVTKPFTSGNNKPPPRIPLTQYTVRQNENAAQNNAVRRQAMQQARTQLRGRIAVAQRPNVLRREIQTNIRPLADMQRKRVVKGMGKKDAPKRVVRGMGKKLI